jgi:hypothetical protein
MRTLFLFFLLITFDVLKAQDDFYNPYFEIKAGDELMLLYDKVKVYEKANTSSKVIDKLPMGKSVVVKSNTIDRSIINGLELPWIEVSYEHEGKEKVGFLWSGFLSLPVENYATDKSLTFLFGVSKIVSVNQKKNTELVLYMNCKVLSQGKLLAKKEFKSIYNGLSYYRNLNVYDNKGLNGIKNILNFDFRNVYYSGEYGSQVFFWDGKQLAAVKNIKNLSDPPCYYTEELIYPNDEGGLKDHILIRADNGCNEGEQQIQSKTGQYIWKKRKLNLQMESKINYH